jgi:hypothetical protein
MIATQEPRILVRGQFPTLYQGYRNCIPMSAQMRHIFELWPKTGRIELALKATAIKPAPAKYNV